MWVFLAARLRLWLLLALVAPTAGWMLGYIGDRLEARNGPTTLSRALQKGRGWLRRRTTGPIHTARLTCRAPVRQ